MVKAMATRWIIQWTIASASIDEAVADTLTDNIAKIGENMTLRRMQTIRLNKLLRMFIILRPRIWGKLEFYCYNGDMLSLPAR